MSSILTNNAAMTALQTLKGINNNLETTQSQISTGKKIASAKDNSAIWAISKTMESDVEGFKSISDTLGLGNSQVAVGKNAAESATDLLTEIKGKITDANGVKEGGTAAQKIQTDIESLSAQIDSVVQSAQFNGVNLVDGSTDTYNSDGDKGVDVLASLNRSGENVTQKNIGVAAQNLSRDDATKLTTGSAATQVTATVAALSGGSATIEAADINFADTSGGNGGAAAISGGDVTGGPNTDGLIVGDKLTVSVDGVEASYEVALDDTEFDVATGLNNALSAAGADPEVTLVNDTTNGLQFENAGGDAADVTFEAARGGGELAGLDDLDVTTTEGIDKALSSVENMIQSSIDAAASFGSSQNRIEIQSNFVGNLMDSLESGVGSLVDANMEEASARLQALQVQQQLGTQSLSIANQAPQSILSLFRG